MISPFHLSSFLEGFAEILIILLCQYLSSPPPPQSGITCRRHLFIKQDRQLSQSATDWIIVAHCSNHMICNCTSWLKSHGPAPPICGKSSWISRNSPEPPNLRSGTRPAGAERGKSPKSNQCPQPNRSMFHSPNWKEPNPSCSLWNEQAEFISVSNLIVPYGLHSTVETTGLN